ncbi:hypothetical protein PHLGIDRAFT_148867 [Phlebiopsis gigantea 11061_1 CR5-6]|uniref:Uncharacterized protein n=1 Tax=Phlebiopsis gigantea (strain 11061_1 CR5-6) TaxID=745531 RepID=A0A0C3NKJ5_PHLG1|nr:hypothetical protein PHLGIDRAFT_148867 [Phlebiopsis gigantea 11061_1 CR5-6]
MWPLLEQHLHVSRYCNYLHAVCRRLKYQSPIFKLKLTLVATDILPTLVPSQPQNAECKVDAEGSQVQPARRRNPTGGLLPCALRASSRRVRLVPLFLFGSVCCSERAPCWCAWSPSSCLARPYWLSRRRLRLWALSSGCNPSLTDCRYKQ